MKALKLDGRIDDIIEMLIDGQTYRTIAGHFNVSLSTLHAFLSRTEHSARARQALEISASSYADKAEEVMLEVNEKSKTAAIEFQKARELAHHYRWKASKRAPMKYGDKLDVTSKGESLTIKVVRE